MINPNGKLTLVAHKVSPCELNLLGSNKKGYYTYLWAPEYRLVGALECITLESTRDACELEGSFFVWVGDE